jgi:hypothetical protein
MMDSSISGKSSHEADTKTTVGCGPGVGRGRRVRAEETFRGYASPAPSRCSLLYTFSNCPGVDARRIDPIGRRSGGARGVAGVSGRAEK